MNRALTVATGTVACAALLSGCATNPRKIEAAHVTLNKYESSSCDQIGLERTAVQYRANILYHSLKRRADADAAKMGFGLVLFLPVLLALKGNNSRAFEFAQLKGDYQALQMSAQDKGCSVEFADFNEAASAKTVAADLIVETRN